MKKQEKGSMTVFLSMILLMVLILIFGLLESARMQAARAQLMLQADLGMFSLFAEYDGDLFEEYDLLFIDGGYDSGSFQKEQLIQRLEKYSGMKQRDGSQLQKSSWIGLSIKEAVVSAVMLAADREGAPFFCQAVTSAKEKLVLSALNNRYSSESQRYLEEGARLLEQADSVSGRIEAIREAAKRLKEEEYQQKKKEAEEKGEICTAVLDTSMLEFENPVKTLKGLLQKGVLELVDGEVSGNSVLGEQLLSRRQQQEGWGTFTLELKKGTLDGLIFNEYILDKLPCLCSGRESTEGEEIIGNAALAYQAEYVLSGKHSDSENLENVLKKLLILRFGINFSALSTSVERTAEAEALAAAMAAAAALPTLEPVMKTAILFLWAFEESLTDVRTLCSGGRVELLKDTENFSCSIGELFSFQIKETIQTEDGDGLDYAGYLRLFLAILPLDTRIFRCMDMVEHTIRIEKERPGFCLDMGIFAVKAEITGYAGVGFLLSYWNGADLKTTITRSYYTEE